MRVTILLQKIAVISVIRTASAAERTPAWYTQLRSFPSCPAPKLCATGIANPAQLPMHRPRVRNWTLVVAPTAARASAPRIWPTIMPSAML